MASVPEGEIRELRDAAEEALLTLSSYTLLAQHEPVLDRVANAIQDVELWLDRSNAEIAPRAEGFRAAS